ncbi:MAG: T9SS type A sorting domain-containing protein [Chitinophagaceae bacterium]|nr:T9SS type A sorting domain-containing protein [Chitinophagaceae bacterium]
MKKKFLFIFTTLCFLYLSAISQITVGNNGLFIKNGSVIYLDRLHLQPSQDINIQNNTLTVSSTPIPAVPKASIARVYEWTNAITIQGLMGIYVPASDLNGNNFSSLQLMYTPNGNPGSWIITGTSVPMPPEFLFSTFGATTWKQLTAVENSSVIPLKLLSFTGQSTDNSVALEWIAANEEGVKDYVVMHSIDATTFRPIGVVQAKCNGCSGEVEYKYYDNQPSSGVNYYKLQMRDLDGNYRFSDVVKVAFNNKMQAVILSPNPTSGKFKISGLSIDNTYKIRITSADGRVMVTKMLSPQSVNYEEDASQWAAGTYFISITDKQGGQWQGKIIKR